MRHHPAGRNKIQDAWSPTVYRVVDVRDTTYAVEPLEGGPSRRVHRVDLRPCVNSDEEIVVTEHSLPSSVFEWLVEQGKVEDADPGYVVLEEVILPRLEEASGVEVDLTSSVEEALGVEPVSVLDSVGQPEESEISVVHEQNPVPPPDTPLSRRPVPAPRRTGRANAGMHSNPFNEPRSTCNSVSLSPEVFSQVLTSLGSVFFREAVKEVKNMY